ncbi:hypothetical protein HAX54_001774 [Datura stramonium]|uniref:Uncharacterized protein n=1 Tax=Datura stramonium TaxID=4076 RepID=A0ABS8T3P2_DATST|nr:hypothetical protein [Datura stramonium]
MSSVICSTINMSHLFKDSKYVGLSRTKRPGGLLVCQLSMDHDRGGGSSMEGVVKCDANYVPLTPISFLERAANVFSERTSVIYGPSSVMYTWEQTYARCLKLASSLVHHLGISRGDVVANTLIYN